ncbi:MAG TPA: phosphatidate cytidylyltransferase, partial [Firmicutes bacterium]|nr:phosphatidate cytidylyltransferase [Bacillota bacterium]
KIFTMLATLMVVFNGYDFASQSFTETLGFGLGMVSFFLFFVLLTQVTRQGFSVNDAGFFLLTIFYVGTTFHSLLYLRMIGLTHFIFLVLVVAISDSAAYFFGRRFGRHKLAPLISPKKTVEGAIGGTLTAVLVGVIFGLVTNLSGSILLLAMTSLVIAIAGQFGDLVASSMKRRYGIKDFGKLFPGHGGV